MIRHVAGWYLVGLLWLAVLSACASQDAERAATDTETSAASWEEHMRAGMTAYQQGHYAETERQWVAGLEQAERFGREGPRLGTSLNDLAAVYQAQGRYAESEPLLPSLRRTQCGNCSPGSAYKRFSSISAGPGRIATT